MMEEKCLLCGDKGFTNAFIHCVRCLNLVVHRYCLDVIPDTVDEFVLWFCDDCDEVQKKRLPDEEKVKHDSVQYADSSDDGVLLIDIIKGKTKHANIQDIFLKENFNEDHVVGNKLAEQSHEDYCTKSDTGKSKKGTKRKFQRPVSLEPIDPDTGRGMAEYTTVFCNGSLKGSKKKRTATSTSNVVRKLLHKIGSARSLKENKMLYNVSCNGNKEPKDRGERMCCESNSCEVCKTNSTISPAEPVVSPVWRGSFNIRSKKHNVLEGFVAHTSPRACLKVHEVASKFGPELCLEKFPRSEVWPKNFETSGTSGDNIALFFFPSKISEHEFDQLVTEMTSKDLALKASLQNAELLIFTSTELPLRYWMFEGKNYLWAVFKGKQRSSLDLQPSAPELVQHRDHHSDNYFFGAKL